MAGRKLKSMESLAAAAFRDAEATIRKRAQAAGVKVVVSEEESPAVPKEKAASKPARSRRRKAASA